MTRRLAPLPVHLEPPALFREVIMSVLSLVSSFLGGFVLATAVMDALDSKTNGLIGRAIWQVILGTTVAFFLINPAKAQEELPPPRERTELECKQAAKLMYDTAVYRDKGGYPATVFERFMHDLELAKQYPPKSRWFVEETQDAVLLYTWLQRIFADGESPDTVRFKFMIDCMGGRLVEG